MAKEKTRHKARVRNRILLFEYFFTVLLYSLIFLRAQTEGNKIFPAVISHALTAFSVILAFGFGAGTFDFFSTFTSHNKLLLRFNYSAIEP